MKKITILGATGSIGTSALKLLLLHKRKYNIQGLTAHKNYKKLAKYSRLLNSKYAVIADKRKLDVLKEELKDTNIVCLAGEENILKIAEIQTDILVSAIVGIAGLRATYKSLGNTKVLALANKESIVCAGKILINKAKIKNTKIIPIDSEHNAIFQVIQNENTQNIKNIVLTASGGPFLSRKVNSFDKITVNEALNHPNWKMGKKITIDSATMMNKLLEIIEASILFNIKLQDINILIHPSSTVHGIVNFIDGTSHIIASKPDMKVSIGYALNWPNRLLTKVNNINFCRTKGFKFFEPNLKKFPALEIKNKLYKEMYKESKIIVLNAANEIAVDLFLKQKIKFSDIVISIKKALNQFRHINVKSIDDVIKIDIEARKITNNIIYN